MVVLELYNVLESFLKREINGRSPESLFRFTLKSHFLKTFHRSILHNIILIFACVNIRFLSTLVLTYPETLTPGMKKKIQTKNIPKGKIHIIPAHWVISNLVQNVKSVTVITTRAVVPAANKTVCVLYCMAITDAIKESATVKMHKNITLRG